MKNRMNYGFTVFAIALLLTVTSGAIGDPTIKQVNFDGFGNNNNRYAWSMKEFDRHLYVGTLNSKIGLPGDCEECDEFDLLLMQEGIWDKDLGLSEGAEIWRFNGYYWEQMMDEGWGNEHNVGVRNMCVYNGALYAGTLNLLTGCEVWKSSQGTSWEQVGQSSFGRIGNTSVRGMTTYDGRLYAGTVNLAGGQVWYTEGDDWIPSAQFGITDMTNLGIATLQEHKGYLFAGTLNVLRGCQIYRFDGSEWQQVVGPESGTPGGFGELANKGILSMADFHGALYAGTVNFMRGFNLWRSTDAGDTWERIGDYGFGDERQKYIWDMEVYGNELFLGTLLLGRQNVFHHGSYLFKSPDGDSWNVVAGKGDIGDLVAPPGFGDKNNYGFRTLEPFFGRLYVGTAQCFFCISPVTGAEVWRLTPDRTQMEQVD